MISLEILRLITDEYKKSNGDIDDYIMKNSIIEPSFNKYCIDLEVYTLAYLFG